MAQLLSGLTILVVEDEFLAALEMKDMIEDRGGSVAGPVGRLEGALALARSEPLDAGVLDVALNGVTSFPVADALIDRAVPVIFATGYAAETFPDRFASTPKLTKPVSRKTLERAFRAVLPDL